MKFGRIGLVSVSSLLILISALAFLFVFKKKPQEPQPRMEHWADISFSGVSFVQSKDGIKTWELRAEQAQLFEKDQTSRLKNILFVMKNKEGMPLTISGESGTMDMAGKNFLIQQEHHPVSIRWGDGYTAQTSELHWSSEKKMIESNKEVKIVGSGISMRGDGVKIFLDRSELTMMGNVHANIN